MSVSKLGEMLREALLDAGASDVGFAEWGTPFRGLNHSVSIVIALSVPIVEEIEHSPTPMYFQHYRAVNAALDQLTLQGGEFLRKRGFRYYPVAASQSVNTEGWKYRGVFPINMQLSKQGLGISEKAPCFCTVSLVLPFD